MKKNFIKKKFIKKYYKKLKRINIKNMFLNKIFLIFIIFIFIFFFFLNNKNHNNFTITENMPIKGIDISNHQGEINWNKVTHRNINFIFIKATEGIKFKDHFFKINWKKASEKKFLKGAYHFFKTGTPGIPQAENFINTVPIEKNTLPPVLDLEIIEGNRYNSIQEIKNFLIKIEKHYKKKPIIYVNRSTYETYIRGILNNYLIWFADYAPKPFYGEEIWTFWQYKDTGIINGINGNVDFNVFKGSKNDLIKLAN